MSTQRTNAPYMFVKNVEVQHSGNILACTLTAPDMDGYVFVGWLGCATHGNVGTPYIEDCSAKSTNVWDAAMAPSATIFATALYRIA